MDLRQESFLFELPYDARLSPGFVLHVKDDPSAEREPDWADFDLQRWLDRDMPPGPSLVISPTEEPMCSTTLMFSVGERRTDILLFPRRAWPAVFKKQMRDHPWPRRLLYYRPVVWLREQSQGRLGPEPMERRTVVQAIRIAPRPPDLSDEWKLGQLRSALEQLNHYLAAAASVHGDPELQPVALQELPPIITGFGYDIPRDEGRPKTIERATYVVHERVADRPRRPIGPAEADVSMWVSAAYDHPMVSVMNFLLSARQAAYRGRYAHAVVDGGTSVEMLVSAGLRLAAPEYGYDSKKLRIVLDGPFKNRVFDHFAPLFGYSRDPEKSTDAVGQWWRDGYLLRNRVVHEGVKPSEGEAEEAVSAADALFRDLGARLMADPKMEGKLIQIPEELRRAAQSERAAIQSLYGPHA